MKLVRRIGAVPRRVAVLDLAAPPRRQHVQGRRAGPLGRARRTEPLLEDTRVARDGDPARALAAAETRRELGACLAELPRGAGDASSRSRTRSTSSFEEISAATGLPVGTAKCYAHRGAQRAAGAAVRMTRRRHGQGRDRGGAAAPRPDAADRRGARARPGRARRRAQDGHRGGLRRPLSRQPDHAGREDGRGARAVRRGRRALAAGERAASSRSSPASTTFASSASCGRATCCCSNARSRRCAARSAAAR